jgi:hypothetical protein
MSGEPPVKFAPLSGLRLFFAIVGILIMVLSGGCSLAFLLGGGIAMLMPALVVGGVPFLLGYVIWRLAARSGREPIPPGP